MPHQAIRLEGGADPVAVLVLERDGLGLADRRRDRVPRLARDLELLEQLLLGQLLEQRGLAAPEDVGLRLALPLDDSTVGDRRPGRDRVDLHDDVEALLRVIRKGLQGGVVDELRDRRDQRQLALDGRLRSRRPDGTQRDRECQQDNSESSHPCLLIYKGAGHRGGLSASACSFSRRSAPPVHLVASRLAGPSPLGSLGSHCSARSTARRQPS